MPLTRINISKSSIYNFQLAAKLAPISAFGEISGKGCSDTDCVFTLNCGCCCSGGSSAIFVANLITVCFYILEIHACSNPSPLTKSMQLYFRNYMKYSYRNTAIVILSIYFFKMTKYEFSILVLLKMFLNRTTFVIDMLLRLM